MLSDDFSRNNSNNSAFFLTLLYLFIDYARPQVFFPIIGKIHPGILIVGSLVVLLLARGNKEYFYDKTSIYFIMLLVLMLVHVPLSINNYWALVTFKSMFISFVIYTSFINFIDNSRRIIFFVKIWIIINIFCAVNGIMHGGLVPGSAFLDDENDFSLVMNMAFAISFFMISISKGKMKVFYFISSLIFVYAIIISMSRGAFIGFITVVFYCWLKSDKKILYLVIILFVTTIFMVNLPDHYSDEIKSIFTENIKSGTGYDRWYMWGCGWRMFLTHPIIGVGQGNFPWNIAYYEPEYIDDFWHSHAGRPAHSLYVTALSEIGILGSYFFICLLIFSVKRFNLIKKQIAIRKKKYANTYSEDQVETAGVLACQNDVLEVLGEGILGALLAYLVTGAFLSVLYYPHFYVFIGLLNSVTRVMERSFVKSSKNFK